MKIHRKIDVRLLEIGSPEDVRQLGCHRDQTSICNEKGLSGPLIEILRLTRMFREQCDSLENRTEV